VEAITSKPFTRNQRPSSLSEQNKSALTDHASQDNHAINWPIGWPLRLWTKNLTKVLGGSVHIQKEARWSWNRSVAATC